MVEEERNAGPDTTTDICTIWLFPTLLLAAKLQSKSHTSHREERTANSAKACTELCSTTNTVIPGSLYLFSLFSLDLQNYSFGLSFSYLEKIPIASEFVTSSHTCPSDLRWSSALCSTLGCSVLGWELKFKICWENLSMSQHISIFSSKTDIF